MSGPRRQAVGGFTLVEALTASVVLAVAMTAVTLPFASAARTEQDDLRRTLASALAEELMEEILTRPFLDPDGASVPGPEEGETSRNLFDNLDDYHGYAEPAGGILSGAGWAMNTAAATGLSRHATADYVYLAGQDTSAVPTFLRITVEVRYQGGTVAKMTRLALWTP